MPNMEDMEDMVPQSPLEGPPLPSGVKAKWTDDPERVMRAIRNYARGIERPEVVERMERQIYSLRFRKGISLGDPTREALNWVASQNRAIHGYTEWLRSKLPKI